MKNSVIWAAVYLSLYGLAVYFLIFDEKVHVLLFDSLKKDKEIGQRLEDFLRAFFSTQAFSTYISTKFL